MIFTIKKIEIWYTKNGIKIKRGGKYGFRTKSNQRCKIEAN